MDGRPDQQRRAPRGLVQGLVLCVAETRAEPADAGAMNLRSATGGRRLVRRPPASLRSAGRQTGRPSGPQAVDRLPEAGTGLRLLPDASFRPRACHADMPCASRQRPALRVWAAGTAAAAWQRPKPWHRAGAAWKVSASVVSQIHPMLPGRPGTRGHACPIAPATASPPSCDAALHNGHPGWLSRCILACICCSAACRMPQRDRNPSGGAGDPPARQTRPISPPRSPDARAIRLALCRPVPQMGRLAARGLVCVHRTGARGTNRESVNAGHHHGTTQM